MQYVDPVWSVLLETVFDHVNATVAAAEVAAASSDAAGQPQPEVAAGNAQQQAPVPARQEVSLRMSQGHM